MSSSVSGPDPLRASISAFVMAESASRSVESRSLSCDFIATFIASVIFSRSTFEPL